MGKNVKNFPTWNRLFQQGLICFFFCLHVRENLTPLSSSRKGYVKNRFSRSTEATLRLRARQIKWLHFHAGMNLGFLLEISEMFSMLLKLQKLHNIKLAHVFMRYFFTLMVRSVCLCSASCQGHMVHPHVLLKTWCVFERWYNCMVMNVFFKECFLKRYDPTWAAQGWIRPAAPYIVTQLINGWASPSFHVIKQQTKDNKPSKICVHTIP